MTVYLDASAVVSMFVADVNTPRAWSLAGRHPAAAVSLWTIAEFSSALGVQVRMGRIDSAERVQAESMFDAWLALRPEPIAPVATDFAAARQMLRASAATLKTPDALHLAICDRLRMPLATFDQRMLEAASRFDVVTIDL